MRAIRGSELQDFLRCRKRWDLRWNQNLMANRPNGKLFIGNLVHKFMEYLYTTNNPHIAYEEMQKLYEETDTSKMDFKEHAEIWDVSSNVVKHYVSHFGEQDRKYGCIGTELRFLILLDPEEDLYYTGTWDMVLEGEDERLWLIDHKTTDSLDKYTKIANMDRQISRYLWVLHQATMGNVRFWNEVTEEWEVRDEFLDKNVGGFLYNIIKKDYPVPPKVLKNNKFSTAKNQKTNTALFMQALEWRVKEIVSSKGTVKPEEVTWTLQCDNLLDELIEEYDEYLEYLQEREKEDLYFRRLEVTRTMPELEASIEEFHATALDMEKARIYRNITGDCSWDCEFLSLCKAEMEGANVGLIKTVGYKQREDVK